MSKKKLVLGPVEEGGWRHAHVHDDRGNVACMRGHAPKEGEPIPPGCVLVQADKDGNVLSETWAQHSGPAQVATDAYRESWERIFGTNKSELN